MVDKTTCLMALNLVLVVSACHVSTCPVYADEQDEINEIVLLFEDTRSIIKTHARIEARKLQVATMKQLKLLQDSLTEAEKLDSALAVRDQIDKLKLQAFGKREWSISNVVPNSQYPQPYPQPYSQPPMPAALTVNEPLPEEATGSLRNLEDKLSGIEKESKAKIKSAKEDALTPLRNLQDRLSKLGQLSQAMHARDAIQYLAQGYLRPIKIKSSLMELQPAIGKSYFVEVTGQIGGSLYGTDYYTSDSYVPAAAIHSGLLQQGQKAILKLTVLPAQTSFTGSTMNGITSGSYGPYYMAYTLEWADD